MGLIEKIFGKLNTKRAETPATGFRTFTDTAPMFTSYTGRLWEQELTRAAIERFGTACSKLKPELVGESKPSVRRVVDTWPNEFMTWPVFLKRLAAIYDADGTAFVVPVLAADGETVRGFWPVRCEYAEIVDYRGEPWVRFHHAAAETSAMELSKTCILSKLQIDSDFFGEPNCIGNTMQLIHAQDQAQESAIQNGAKVRFIGKLNGMVREEDMKEKRKRFVEDNLRADNEGGLMLYDTTFDDIRQVEPQSYVMSSEEMQRIQDNVCNYFGCSMPILQNSYTEDQWGAWYEGKIEPFAIQLGEGLTRICFSQRERRSNHLTFSSSRLEYASNPSKRNMVRDMVDRGIMSLDEAREVLQLPRIEGGDVRVIRGEYVNAAAVSSLAASIDGGGKLPMNVHDGERDLGGNDKIYQDSDGHNVDDFDE